jgi:hypothetical protein
MDGLYWAARHALDAWRAPRSSKRRTSLVYGAVALFIGAFVLALPITAVALPELDGLKPHALAFALGAFVWSVILELAAQPERNARYDEQLTISSHVIVRRVAALAAIEIALFYVLRFTGQGRIWAFGTGLTLIGMADVMSVLVTFAIGPFGAAPLRRP